MPATAEASLTEYRAKRDFRKTAEPAPEVPTPKHRRPIFVVQEHHASKLHYDFRLEYDGVLKSWAVPREPSMDPADKRLAVQVEDHPIPYARFEGTIPRGQYGAGEVHIWDRGTFELAPGAATFGSGLAAGKVEFVLHGEKLKGRFTLVRMKDRGDKNWLLIKGRDQFANSGGGNGKPAAKPATDPRRKPVVSRPAGTAPDEIELPTATGCGSRRTGSPSATCTGSTRPSPTA